MFEQHEWQLGLGWDVLCCSSVLNFHCLQFPEMSALPLCVCSGWGGTNYFILIPSGWHKSSAMGCMVCWREQVQHEEKEKQGSVYWHWAIRNLQTLWYSADSGNVLQKYWSKSKVGNLQPFCNEGVSNENCLLETQLCRTPICYLFSSNLECWNDNGLPCLCPCLCLSSFRVENQRRVPVCFQP